MRWWLVWDQLLLLHLQLRLLIPLSWLLLQLLLSLLLLLIAVLERISGFHLNTLRYHPKLLV